MNNLSKSRNSLIKGSDINKNLMNHIFHRHSYNPNQNQIMGKFSDIIEQVFKNDTPNTKSTVSKIDSIKSIPNLVLYSKSKKYISKSVFLRENKILLDEGLFYFFRIKFSKSMNEKKINLPFCDEQIFAHDLCFDGQINFLNNDYYELHYINKNDKIRKSYITKLIYNKIWEPNLKPKIHNSLIIFDWDDTLLCTTYLTPNGIFNESKNFSEKVLEKIKKIEDNVYELLKLAISKGDTYIITNAALGWVEYSTKRFYPKIIDLLKNIKIISARGKFDKIYPNNSRMWKISAFLEMQENFDRNLVTNIICLGDSVIEIEASQILASTFSQAYIKTIKFKEDPKPEELNKQLLLVLDQFNSIYSTVKNLTIKVEKKSKNEKFFVK